MPQSQIQTIWTDERLDTVKQRLSQGRHHSLNDMVRWAMQEWGLKTFPDIRNFQRKFQHKFSSRPGDLITREAVQAADSAASEIRELKAQVQRLRGQIEDRQDEARWNRKFLDVIEKIRDTPAPPAWVVDPHPRHVRHGVPSICLSDLHYGEVVHPEQVDGWNKYNVEIAHKRMERLAQKTADIFTQVFSGAQYPGIVIPIAGDLVCGNNHGELIANAETGLFRQILGARDLLIKFILTMANTFKRVYVPIIHGNHGELRPFGKVQYKNAAEDSADWMIGQLVKEQVEKETSGAAVVQVSMSDSLLYRLMGVRYLLHHGHSFKGGSGISGILTPLSLGNYRLHKQRAGAELWLDTAADFDQQIFGHFHQYLSVISQGWTCNGSIKGYDEYAKGKNLPYEPPRQAAWLTHPEYGVTFPTAIYCDKAPRAARDLQGQEVESAPQSRTGGRVRARSTTPAKWVEITNAK